jgi:hypothetical protein
MTKPKILFPLDREERKNYVMEFLNQDREKLPEHVRGYVIGFLDAIQFTDERPSDDLNFEAVTTSN